MSFSCLGPQVLFVAWSPVWVGSLACCCAEEPLEPSPFSLLLAFFSEKQAVKLLLEAALPNNGCQGSGAAERFGSRCTALTLSGCGHRRRVMDSGEIRGPCQVALVQGKLGELSRGGVSGFKKTKNRGLAPLCISPRGPCSPASPSVWGLGCS